MSRAKASAKKQEEEDPEVVVDDTGKDEKEADDWLGDSEDEDDKVLMEKEEKFKRNQDEFVEDMKRTEVPEELVNLKDEALDYDSAKLKAQALIEKISTSPENRGQYRDELKRLLCALYGYNEFLMDELTMLIPPQEWMDFCDANEHERPVVIRTNTLRTRAKELERCLSDRGVRLGSIGSWSKLGLIVFDSQVPLGATPEYLSGHYMLQSPSSFLPVMALNPKPNMRVLDMCAAPGGKTTHMAQLMKNTGCIIANDVNKARAQSLIANIHRLGVTNTIVVNYDGRAFPEVMGGFDMVLLDAPCSGTGVISRDPSVKTSRSKEDVRILAKNQKEMILKAFDSVKTEGGKLCYCTCSLLIEENEEIVDYLLSHRKLAKCIPPGIDKDFDDELEKGYLQRGTHKMFHQSVQNSRRVYPHRMNMDGFFFALIDCLPGPRGPDADPDKQPTKPEKPKEQKTEAQKRKEKKKKQKGKKFSKRFGGK